MNPAGEVLASLKDVSGIEGSFVVGAGGALLARDMAAVATDDVLGEVGARLVRLAETFSANGAEVLSFVVKYTEHLLFVRQLNRGTLCVITSPGVSLPALRMGVNLAVRRLVPLLTETAATVPSAPRRSTGFPLPAPAPTVERRWRGAVVPPRR